MSDNFTFSFSIRWNLNHELRTRNAFNKFNAEYMKDFKKFKTAKAYEKLENQRGLEKELNKELKKGKKVKDINILYPFFRTYKIELFYAVFYKLISITAGFGSPFLLDLILSYIRTKDDIVWKVKYWQLIFSF